MAQFKDVKRNTWYFKCYDKSGKQILRRGFATKREAKIAEASFLEKCQHVVATSIFESVQSHHRKFYCETKKPRTIRGYDDVVKLHILPFFSSMEIHKIHQRDIFNWQQYILNKNLSKSRSQKCYIILNMIFKHAMRFFDLHKNVCAIVGNFEMSETKTPFTWWEEDEFNLFLSQFNHSDQTEKKYYIIFNVLFYTGIRVGELLGLTWNDIDFEHEFIHIKRSVHKREISTPKTNSSIRSIYMQPKIATLLKEIQVYSEKLFEFNKDFFVFGDIQPLHNNTLQNRWYKYLSNMEEQIKRIKLHDLRHSHATYLFRHDFNIMYISQRLGHKNTITTQEVYIHLAKELEQNSNIKLKEL